METQYFASLPPPELCKELKSKTENYYQWLLASGRLGRWRVAYDTYYGQRLNSNASFVTAGGKQGELSLLMSNEYRNLIQHLIILTTQNKPTVETVATNTDMRSQAQCILAKQILDYINREAKLNRHADFAIEMALIMDFAWVFTEYDFTIGQDIRPDDIGSPIKTGFVTCRARTPLDVVVDHTLDNGQEYKWQIVRDLVNKYDLAAQYPNQAEEILNLKRDRSKDILYRFGDQNYYGYNYEDSPMIEKWTFYHKPCPALPAGRLYEYVSDKVFLVDAPLPYPSLPGRRCCPSEQIMSGMGYSNANILLGLQDVMDAMVSAGVTNMTSFGANTVWSKPNQNFDFEQLTNSMNLIEAEEKPEILMLNRLPPEWFNLTNFIIGRLEAYSGVNSVARGNVTDKNMSGAAMALLESMSLRFNSGLQKAYGQMVEDIYQDALTLVQKFAKEPQVAAIAGENNQYLMKEFTADDISNVKRVFVRLSNNLESTTSGRLTIAQDLLKIPNVITNATKYMTVLRTGSTDALVENEEKMQLAIKQENERLGRGETVEPAFSERHDLHLLEHASILWSPEAKNDPSVIAAVQDHVDKTLMLWQQTPPDYLAAFGIPPYPVPMGVPGMGGGGEILPPLEPNQGGPENPKEASEPGQPGMPNMPVNPLSGNEYNNETGGL